jgi:hypothetical protein
MKHLVAAIASLALTLLVCACGSTRTTTVVHTLTRTVTETLTVAPAATATTPPPAASTTPTATTGGATPSPAGTTTGPGVTTTTGGSVATVACTSAYLKPAFLSSNGATGRVVLAFALRNVAQAACHTYGWPGVAFAAADGSALPTSTARTTSDLLGSTPPAALTLGSGQQASFRVIVPDSSNGTSAGCHRANAVRIIAPDDTATVVAGLRAPVTECGTATVSPLLAGTDALPGV